MRRKSGILFKHDGNLPCSELYWIKPGAQMVKEEKDTGNAFQDHRFSGLWTVCPKGHFPFFKNLGHWLNFVLKSINKENKGPTCNAQTLQNYFQLLDQVMVSQLQVEDTMTQHISATSQDIYMNHGMNHIQNVFVMYQSHQVESRPQSLEKKGSETGSNLGHSPAKNIWMRSLWLLSLIPSERLQNVRCQEMKLLTLSLHYSSPKLGRSLYRGQTASLRIPCRRAQGFKLHRRTLMPPEFLSSCLHPAPWPSSAQSWTELTSPPSIPMKLSLWETKRSTRTTSRSPCFLLTRLLLFQF